MQSKKKKYSYVQYLNNCAERGMTLIGGDGLCREGRWDRLNIETLELFQPSVEDKLWLRWEGHSTAYWGSDSSSSMYGELTNFRLTIILFMAAINGEL